MMNCTSGLSLQELLTRPAVELRLVGAEGSDEDDKSKEETKETGKEDDKDDKSKSDDKSGDDKDDKSKSGKAEPDARDRKIASLEEEKDRHYDLRKASEKERDELKAELAQLKVTGVTDEETKTRLADLEKTNSRLTVKVEELGLENAFLKDNTRTWIDPEAALRLADLSKVEIDSDGKVHGLASALDKLASKSPYLLKADESANKDDKSKEVKKSGDQPGSKDSKDEKSKAADKAALQRKYPGLRR